MKLIIDIPENFKTHYCFDKFDDSLKRIREDIHNHFFKCQISISGNYELELLDMLDQSFKDSVVYNENEDL